MSRDWLLFLHLAGVLLFVGGSVAVTALRLLAIGKERPSESAVLLRATRPLIPLVLVGLLLTLGAGFSLADELGVPLDANWLGWTYGLVVWLVVVGAIAGRLDRKTRELAEREAAERETPSPELARRLRDPIALTLDASMLVATIAIVALMVWKP
ncbi:MAG TPA: DUF2269 family protein [Gaiella sp.]